MNGGTASVAGAFGLGFSGGMGIMHINGGTLTLSQWAANSIQGSGSVLDVGSGKVVIAGNQVASVNGFIAGGKITAYGGSGNVVCSYNGTANTTTITASQSSHYIQKLQPQLVIDAVRSIATQPSLGGSRDAHSER